MTDTSLYFEAHVTIEPVEENEEAHLREICEQHGFRLAELLLKKDRQKSPYDSFCTGRGKDYELLYATTMALVGDLEFAGFEVWRYKIEETLLDVRTQQHPKKRRG